MNNKPITVALRPIQGVNELYSPGYGAIPQIELSNALFFKVWVECWPSTPYSSLGLEIGDADTAYKKDCYSEDTMGVSYTHSLISKSLTVTKRILIKNRVSYKF